jgi:penicillin-binding protein 2
MKSSGRGKELRENAWFVGFAPRDNPEIVVVALFEHGEHGQYAAAVVRDVLKAYFDKKERLEAMRQGQTKVAAIGGPGSGVGGQGSGNSSAAPLSVPVGFPGAVPPSQSTPAATPRSPAPDPRPQN